MLDTGPSRAIRTRNNRAVFAQIGLISDAKCSSQNSAAGIEKCSFFAEQVLWIKINMLNKLYLQLDNPVGCI